MAKSKFVMKLGPISLLFWPKVSTSLWGPLGCSDLSQICFGSSPIVIERKKIVAEIIYITFDLLRHHRAGSFLNRYVGMGDTKKGCIEERMLVVFNQKPPSINECLLSMIIFHQNLSFNKGCLLYKVVFCQKPFSENYEKLIKKFFYPKYLTYLFV